MTNDEPALKRVKADSPDALLAIVPHLLGFYPSQSLVVLGIGGPHSRVRVTFRYDLPDPPDSALAADIAEHAASVLRREGLDAAALIGYGPSALVAPVLVTAADWLAADGVEFREVLRAEGGRFWSLLCADPDCCPADGRPFDPGSHPLAVTMTSAGLAALPDRAALARTLLPPAGSSAEIRRATRLAEERLEELRTRERAAGADGDPRLSAAKAARAAVQRAIRQYRAGRAITNREELAWLAVLVADLRVRDDAWARMVPPHQAAHCRLWTDVIRGAATEYIPAPASLLAFTAWQSGNGGLASVAIERALAARPGYSMALLLEEALRAGLPPSAARLRMTPAQVAASYAAQDAASSDEASQSARTRPVRSRSGTTTSGASTRPSG